MKRVIVALPIAFLFTVTSAFAYNINHSYSAPGNATEYYGSCANGDQIIIIEKADGRYAYSGPAGKGTLKEGDLDIAARTACGE